MLGKQPESVHCELRGREHTETDVSWSLPVVGGRQMRSSSMERKQRKTRVTVLIWTLLDPAKKKTQTEKVVVQMEAVMQNASDNQQEA